MTHTSVPVLSKALAGPSMVTMTRSSLRTRLRIRHAGALSARVHDDDDDDDDVQSQRCTERGKYLATVTATPHMSEREARHMFDRVSDAIAAMHQRETPGRDGDKAPRPSS